MNIGDAKIIISADDKASDALKKTGMSLDDLGKKATIVGGIMVAAGAAMVFGIFKMADSYTKAGDEIAKMAKRTGIATKELSIMRHIAGLSGTSLDSIEKGMKRMGSTLEDAKDGLSTATIAFEKLGLNIDDIVAMSPEEQFWAISEAVAAIEDPTKRAALAQDVFGRAGTELLPILADGKVGLDEMRQSALDTATIFDGDAAKAAEKYQDAIFRLKEELAKLGAEFIDDIIPALTSFIEKTIIIIGKVVDWAEAHSGLAKALFILGGILMVGGAVLLGLGMLAKAIIAINAALIVLHALGGPAGWAKLAIGIGLAAAAIYGMSRLLEPGQPEVTAPALPAMDAGGIVPGPFGQPVPIMAHGGELVSGLRGQMGTTINIEVGTFVGNESAFQEFARTIGSAINQNGRRTAFATVNPGYFGGSSAP